MNLQLRSTSLSKPPAHHVLSPVNGKRGNTKGKEELEKIINGMMPSVIHLDLLRLISRSSSQSLTISIVKTWLEMKKHVSRLTSRILGMMSRSHCRRNKSLSKLGSAFRISVSTSDISVLENRPPTQTIKEQTQFNMDRIRLFFFYFSIGKEYIKCQVPIRSVTLSVTARVARIKALSLSSYFIFMSKNPVEIE